MYVCMYVCMYENIGQAVFGRGLVGQKFIVEAHEEKENQRKKNISFKSQCIEKGRQGDNFIYVVNAYFLTHQTFLAWVVISCLY